MKLRQPKLKPSGPRLKIRIYFRSSEIPGGGTIVTDFKSSLLEEKGNFLQKIIILATIINL